MPSKRVMRGGNANVRPIEYYGGNSGRYFENPAPSSSEFAYGGYHPVSHGVIDADGNIPLLIVGSIALGFALFNVIGGFFVTDRMLAMFDRKKNKKN